jgi:hypothetical protein
VREPDHWVSSEMTGSILFHVILLKLFLKLLLKLFLNTCARDKDHDIFDPGSRSDGLSLPRNWYRDKDMFLELSKDKIMIVLELSYDDPRPNSMLRDPHFVDHF